MTRHRYKRSEYIRNHIEDFISLFYPELKKELKECNVLNIGCNLGYLDIGLSPYVKSVRGIDIRPNAIQTARNRAKKQKIRNVHFTVQSGFDLDEKEKYDIVLLSDVLEHVKEQKRFLEKSLESLKGGGIKFLSTPNKWVPIDAHKKLLFLGYLPSKLANKYSQYLGKGSYEGCYLLGYSKFVGLLNLFQISYTFKTWPNPQKLIHKIGKPLVDASAFFWRFSNAFQVIVKKNNSPLLSRVTEINNFERENSRERGENGN